MPLTNEQLVELSAGTEQWLRGKIEDAEVDKCVNLIEAMNSAQDGAKLSIDAIPENQSITGITGSVLCVVFYWRIAMYAPDGQEYFGNAGGIGSVGASALQGGSLTGIPDLNTLYANAISFQFNSIAVALNVNFFDGNSNLVGAFIGGGVGVCMGTGGGSGCWSPTNNRPRT